MFWVLPGWGNNQTNLGNEQVWNNTKLGQIRNSQDTIFCDIIPTLKSINSASDCAKYPEGNSGGGAKKQKSCSYEAYQNGIIQIKNKIFA